MKRVGVTRLGNPEDVNQGPTTIQQQPGGPTLHNIGQPNQQIIGTTLLSVGTSSVSAQFVRAQSRPPLQNVGVTNAAGPGTINYLKSGTGGYKPTPLIAHRHKPIPPVMGVAPVSAPTTPTPPPPPPSPQVSAQQQQPNPPQLGPPPPQTTAAQFQRLKVEDALGYLDQVKFKFSSQPQVYNDFLDIMKEFKSQSIDTPGVIARVSNLFKDHPELIVGFNTFLPPGYKIEVQANGQGITYQVSVSMPSPSGMGTSTLPPQNVMIASQQQQLLHLLPVPASVVQNLSTAAAAAAAQQASSGNTLHHISQAHQQLEANPHHVPPQGQPVEFNHAIEYVNKIKSRFSRQPDKYKRFLEILHAYQRGHREVKEPQVKQQTEQEVYLQVAKLFENQDDLLAEFGQFLPDATAPRLQPPQRLSTEGPPVSEPSLHEALHSLPNALLAGVKQHTVQPVVQQVQNVPQPLKRSPSFSAHNAFVCGGQPATKKARLSTFSGPTVRDVSYAEASKYATLNDFGLFDKVRKALRSQEVYDNFLRCLLLFTNEVISKSELSQVVAPFLLRHPELQRYFNDLVGLNEEPVHPPVQHQPVLQHTNAVNSGISGLNTLQCALQSELSTEAIGPLGAQIRNERPQGDTALDVDLSACKRLGASYCAVPRNTEYRKCSGRSALCKDVLNDNWVSFPTWSEDSTFVTSRKTQYEEYIYRCEDERFELDVVIETNASTIRVLEGVQKKLTRMSSEDAAKYRLDDCLGGHSTTIHRRALRRIYGEKANDIIAGLKKNPQVAVPVVLRRLKAKEEEWREAQKGFNKQWREQNEKYYLKSLDHQGINFKQNDLKSLRSKSLYNEIEAAYAQRRPPPHLSVDLNFDDNGVSIVRDTAELLIHHARRQTAIQKAEKCRIKQLLRHFVPDLFRHPRQPLSDDDEEKEEPGGGSVLDSGGGKIESDAIADIKEDEESDSNEATKVDKTENSSESDTNNSCTENTNTTSNTKSAKQQRNKEQISNNHLSSQDTSLTNQQQQKQLFNELGAETKDSKENIRPLDPEQKLNSMTNSNSIKTEPLGNCLNEHSIKMEERDDKFDSNESVFVCTSSWYLFLRLHAVLCSRLAAAHRKAKELALQEQSDKAKRDPPVAMALRLRPGGTPVEKIYTALLDLVKGALDGNVDSIAYEDSARNLLGIHAYPAYTLDKIVSYAVRQLQHCVSEQWSIRATEMASRGGLRSTGVARANYIRRATRYLRAEHTAFLVQIYGGAETNNTRVTFEMLEGAESPQHSVNSPAHQMEAGSNGHNSVSRLAEWSRYTERYSNPGTRTNFKTIGKPLFLRRNVRVCGGTCDSCHVVAQQCVGTAASAAATQRWRRKPAYVTGTEEATLNRKIRHLSAGGGLRLYRKGSLYRAKSTHSRLHAMRRATFKALMSAHIANSVAATHLT